MSKPVADQRFPKAVFLDAGMTLLAPRVSVAEVYLREAGALGVQLDQRAFYDHLGSCWAGIGIGPRRDPAVEHVSSDEIERSVWQSFTRAVAEPFPGLKSLHEAWLERLVAHFDSGSAWNLAEGALDLIGGLRRRGCRVGVVSNWHCALHRILEQTGVAPHLDFVVVSADIGWRKPHPGIFAEALRRAGAMPEEAIHVGDSVRDDVAGARAAGIRCVLLASEDPSSPLPEGTVRVPHFAGLSKLLLDGRAL